MSTPGTIYWIGTGPGDPGLITVRGLALLQEAQAIVTDRLGQARLLQQASPDAEIHDIGSLSTGNKWPQADVNRLLIDLARRHQTVVRLWAGDPFVFGRAAEEMSAAREAGISISLVPGVSSALAAPAYAGAPLTHWQHAAAFAVVSGFYPDDSPLAPDWKALSRIDTLVIMLPLQNLADIVARLQSAGKAAQTPALIVQHGSYPQQKQVHTTLGGLVEAVRQHTIKKPAVVVLGAVAQLAPQLAWFTPTDFPLLGRRVLVTRPHHQAADFMADLRKLGAEPVAYPTIEIKPVADTAPLDAAIQKIADFTRRRLQDTAAGPAPYDWLVLTSANGVWAFWQRMAALGLDSRLLASVRVAAIGPATAQAMAQYSLTPDLVPEVYTAEGVLAAFDNRETVAGRRFLLARADIARKALAEGLAARGAAVVDEIPAYRTVPVESGPPPPPVDIITFTSSSTVQGYVNCLAGADPAESVKESRVVCIGPITANTADSLGLPVHAVAEAYTIDGLLAALQTLE